VRIWERNVERGWPTFAVSHPNFLDWRSQARALESLAATNNAGFTWTSNGEAEVVLGLSVTATCLPTLKISPVVGRNFLERDIRLARSLPGGTRELSLVQKVDKLDLMNVSVHGAKAQLSKLLDLSRMASPS
jgi:hypothetical protein